MDSSKFTPDQVAFLRDFLIDFPFRVGMTRQAVLAHIDRNNRRVEALVDADFKRQLATGKFEVPIFADPDRRLYIFNDESLDDPKSWEYWINGRTQYWLTLAFEANRVSKVTIRFGNYSTVFPPIDLQTMLRLVNGSRQSTTAMSSKCRQRLCRATLRWQSLGLRIRLLRTWR